MNLNQSIGWQPINAGGLKVVFLEPLTDIPDSTIKQIENQILLKLQEYHVGSNCENDDAAEKEMHFIIKSDFGVALAIINNILIQYKVAGKISVYEREYSNSNNWIDKKLR